jgi:hypothetical protein
MTIVLVTYELLRNKEIVGVAGSQQNTVLGENDRKAEEDVVGRTRERGGLVSP